MSAKTTANKAAQPSKRAGIHCQFKPKASERKIRFASNEEAQNAGRWAVAKYKETFRILSK